MDLFTIGHSNYSVDRLIDMLRYYHINCIVDIRGTPYSKYNIQFNKETIRQTLIDQGYKYIYMGKEFAAQREDKRLYKNDGYADFEKVIYDKDFLNGIERLKSGCKKGYRIALMGAMQDPINCHRCILLGRALQEEGFNLKHICDDYSLASQEDLEERLLEKYYYNKDQITVDVLLGTELSREEMLGECYRQSNKEIGYRVEKLKRK
ncbi:DUF488 domain-containing protein [Cellulosilyticum sp. I15G10I2]|uniref:DUF488 domain-containing protein n=1 Tax=Cellulosilyticum sp. I15G10I2 TaxID=1892843 RepID=UPI00085C2399|nr:DUF488 domain-containing protein [Cellulosilyticum sp. I15G10I2]